MAEREPPKRTRALFKPGDHVEVENFDAAPLRAEVVYVTACSEEDLIRYAYCFFWKYLVRFTDGTEGEFSENLLRLALIEQLGSLVEDDC